MYSDGGLAGIENNSFGFWCGFVRVFDAGVAGGNTSTQLTGQIF